MPDSPVRTAFALRTRASGTLTTKYMPDETKKEEYDYNAPIEKTSVEIAKMILVKVDEVKDFVIIENFAKADPVTKAAFAEKSTDMCIDVMREIAKTDIPYPYATRGIDKIIYILQTMKSYIDGSANQNLDEFTARNLGTRDPETNKFSKEDCTFGELMLKLDEARKATGDDKYDYLSKPDEVKEPVDATPTSTTDAQ